MFENVMDDFTIKRLEQKIEAQNREIDRITKAFLSLQEFYDDKKYKEKLLYMGVVLF